MDPDTDDIPVIPILLLGDDGVGKSTFLSRLTVGAAAPASSLPTLRDLDQPFVFEIRLYNRNYRFEFYDTACPTSYTLLRPALIIVAFSIANPESLASVHTRWKQVVEAHFNYDELLPVMVLGLCRDIREKEDYDGRVRRKAKETSLFTQEDGSEPLNGRQFVYPQEGLGVAQAMRCDRYCECSALTGELCREVIEDISRTAARTTTQKGAKTEGATCLIM